jgi:hypothetical protein
VGDVYFGYFLKITKLAKKIFVYFFQDKCYVSIWTKSGWATFWAIFSQTHLVTLVKMDRSLDQLLSAAVMVVHDAFRLICESE